uniref:DUF4303 domain-containing protein n=1 Tax=Thaumasiovibrio occultus TaxID=1891184 RepID=UPI000B35A989|nr:DUF4303 domain-containing protein [Thaumasiovibrio occultus]
MKETNMGSSAMSLETLRDLIAQAAKCAFVAVREELGEANIAGYAILSHDCAYSCTPVVVTHKAMTTYQHGSAQDVLFSVVEWDHYDNSERFAQVNDVLLAMYEAGDDEIDDQWHEKFRELVFEANVQALEHLVGEGFFGDQQARNTLFVLFSLSDSETFDSHEPQWVARLNTAQVTQQNAQWRETLDTGMDDIEALIKQLNLQ